MCWSIRIGCTRYNMFKLTSCTWANLIVMQIWTLSRSFLFTWMRMSTWIHHSLSIMRISTRIYHSLSIILWMCEWTISACSFLTFCSKFTFSISFVLLVWTIIHIQLLLAILYDFRIRNLTLVSKLIWILYLSSL